MILVHKIDTKTFYPDSRAHEICERLNADECEQGSDWTHKVVHVANGYAYIVTYDEDGKLLGAF